LPIGHGHPCGEDGQQMGQAEVAFPHTAFGVFGEGDEHGTSFMGMNREDCKFLA
jgi:hypothetical protein